MRAAYNARLRRYLDKSHAMETRQFFTISGKDMTGKFGYRECPAR